jgi:predicted phage terminase large subunit-like protein
LNLPEIKSLLRDPVERQKLSVGKLHYPGRTGPKPWDRVKHLEILNKWLVDLYKGEKQALLVSCAPRHGKTELVGFWHILWRLHKDPTTHVIFLSHTFDRARATTGRVRNFLREVGEDLGLQISASKSSEGHFILEGGGSVRAAGVNTGIRGNPANLLLGDDLVKSLKEANSEIQRAHVMEMWQGDALNRLEPGGSIALIGSRYHEDDIMGRLEKLSRKNIGLHFDIYKLVALIESEEQAANDPLGRKVGDPLWPERYSKEMLLQLKSGTIEDPDIESMNPFIWGAVYQQDPTPVEGSIIDPTWWQFYKSRPQGFDEIIQSWDLAFKGKESSDHVVGQVWGRDGANFYLLDQVRARMHFVQTLDAIRNMSEKWPDAGRKLIEDAANGPAVIQALIKEIRGLIPVKTQGTDKGSRLFSVSHLVEAKQVFLPNISLAPWVNEFIHEVTAFRANADNLADDQVDAMSQALRYFLPKGKASLVRAAHTAEKLAEAPKTTADMMFRDFHKRLSKEVDRNMQRKERSRPRWERMRVRF